MTIPDDAALAAKKRKHRNERIVATILVLIAGSITAVMIRWNQREGKELRRDLRYIPKQNIVTPEILMLRDYVRIDTSTPKGIAEGARWLAAELARRGVQSEIIASAPDYLNVYARIKGKNRGGGLLLFNHIDVVPPGDNWTHPPFEAVMIGNEMYGRGTLDMKALAICQLLAFADIAQSGRMPDHDIVFLATAEEEHGSDLGMKWLVAHRPDLFDGLEYGITEGGLTEVMTEKMSYFGIETGGKQVMRVVLSGGDSAHLRRVRMALEPYLASREPGRILPEVKTFFRDLAPTRIAFRDHLADIDRMVAEGKFWQLPPSYRDMTQNSMWLTGPHLADGRWIMRATMVNLPDELPANRLAWLREKVEPYGVKVDVEKAEGPVPFSPSDTRLFRILTDTARRQYHVTAGSQVLFRSVSDARVLRPRGMICYGICPYPVNYFQSLTIHKRNERIRLDWFGDGVKYTRDVVRAWAYE